MNVPGAVAEGGETAVAQQASSNPIMATVRLILTTDNYHWELLSGGKCDNTY